MIEVICKRTDGGLIPLNEEEEKKLAIYQDGQIVKVKFSKMRNAKFFRKWFALVTFAYDYWTETQQMPEYKGEIIEPNFSRFRRDVTILAGHFTYVVDINGDTRAEADSLKWGSMTEDVFDNLYNSTINVILRKVYKNKSMSEEKLRGIVQEILSYS